MKDILVTAQGAMDMLRESAKAHRLKGDDGHAEMCEAHAAELAKVLTDKPNNRKETNDIRD